MTDEVTFIFLGQKLPRYAIASLKLAVTTSGMKICIIGNRAIENSVFHLPVRFVAVEDFYDPRAFSRASTRVWTDHRFRDGLWLKSLERLFVLYQYMMFSGTDGVFHAELDQMLFQIKSLCSHLDSLMLSGIFLPFHNQNSAVASVIYVNDSQALASLLSFGSADFFYPNEMRLIAEWAAKYPRKVFELPTVASYFHQREKSVIAGVRLLSPRETGGLVDAAQVGQWVAGIDPKNVPILKKPTTKFVDAPDRFLLTEDELKSLKFRINHVHELIISQGDVSAEQNLYNLHIHSKIHSEVEAENLKLDKLIDSSNLQEQFRIPGTRFNQVSGWLTFGISKFIGDPRKGLLFIVSRLYQRFGMHLSSSPHLSIDSYRAFADHIYESGKRFDLRQVGSGNIIYCGIDSWEVFKSSVLSVLKHPVVLIIGNPSKNFDSKFLTGVDLPRGSCIYAMNLLHEMPNVSLLPIGFENRNMARYGLVSSVPKVRPYKETKEFRIAWNFAIGENPVERSRAALALMDSPNTVEVRSRKSKEFFCELSRYGFVACPPGQSLDTHLVWEAIYLGCVPILLDSYLSRYFESLNLPIWIVQSFQEVTKCSESELANRYQQIQAKHDSAEVKLTTWQKRIAKSSIQLKP